MMASSIAANQSDQLLGGSQVLTVGTPMLSQSLGQQIIGEAPTYISQIQTLDSLPAPTQLQLTDVYPLTNVGTVPQTLYNVSTIQPVQSQVIPLTNVSTIQPAEYQTGSLVRTVLKPVVKTGYQSVIRYKPVVKTSYALQTKYVPVVKENPEVTNMSLSTINPVTQQYINLDQTVPLDTSVQVPTTSIVPQPTEIVPLTNSVQVPTTSMVPQINEIVPLTTSIVPQPTEIVPLTTSIVPQPTEIVPLSTSIQVPTTSIIPQPVLQ